MVLLLLLLLPRGLPLGLLRAALLWLLLAPLLLGWFRASLLRRRARAIFVGPRRAGRPGRHVVIVAGDKRSRLIWRQFLPDFACGF
jgi:hypothetical protein